MSQPPPTGRPPALSPAAPGAPGSELPEADPVDAAILARLDLLDAKVDWVASHLRELERSVSTPSVAQEASRAPASSHAAEAAGRSTPPVASAQAAAQVPEPGSGPAGASSYGLAPRTTGAPTRTDLPPGLSYPEPGAGTQPPRHPAQAQPFPAQPQPFATQAPRHPAQSQPFATQAPRHPAQAQPFPAQPQPFATQAQPFATQPQPFATQAPRYPAQPQPVPGQPRTPTEGAVGRYVLSFAAALLILLAAASLIALVWDSIPDVVKVGSVGLAGLALTGAGVVSARRSARHRLAAATVMGTGGGLVFVAIVGGVLLDGLLPLPVAFVMLALWAALLVVASSLTRVFFTAVVAGIGGLVTVGLITAHAADHPEDAVTAAVMTAAYATVLGLVTAVTARTSTEPRMRPWHVLTSLVVSLAALVCLPLPEPALMSEPVVLGAVLLVLALVLAQQVAVSALGDSPDLRMLWPVGWALIGVALVILTVSLPTDPWYRTITALTVGLVLIELGATALVAARLPLPRATHLATGYGLLAATALVGFLSLRIPGDHLWLTLTVVLVVTATGAPCLRGGHGFHLVIVPALVVLLSPGLIRTADRLSYYLEPDATAHTSQVSALIAIAVVLTGIVGPLVLEGGARWDPRPQSELAGSAWLVALLLGVVLPQQVMDTVWNLTGISNAWSTCLRVTAVSGLVSMLIALGLGDGPGSPRRLLSGAGRGGRARVLVRPLPSGQVMTGVSGNAVTVAILGNLGLLLCVTAVAVQVPVLPRLVATPFVLVLAAALVWLMWPVVSTIAGTWAVAATLTISAVGAVAMVSGDGPVSVPATVALMGAGAVCIRLGFTVRAPALRHYGLGLVLLMVVKSAVLDIAGQNSVVRILALLVAGLICFALSLVYNRFSGQTRSHTAAPVAQPAPHAPGQPGETRPSGWIRPDGGPGPR